MFKTIFTISLCLMALNSYAQGDTRSGGGSGGGKGGNGGGGNLAVQFILKPTYVFNPQDCRIFSLSGPEAFDHICKKVGSVIYSGERYTDEQYLFYATCCPDFESQGNGGVLASPF